MTHQKNRIEPPVFNYVWIPFTQCPKCKLEQIHLEREGEFNTGKILCRSCNTRVRLDAYIIPPKK